MRYYVIKISNCLKGKGIISNFLIPVVLITIVYVGTSIISPWIVKFPGEPKGEELLMIDQYLGWIILGGEIIWDEVQNYLWFFDQLIYLQYALGRILTFGPDFSC
ncbi:hypothetical protein [Paraliobacillus sp. JSM ZJ581]|uniref:hypothetical protein n=1 Tax=Paraliobacillus sp. JSM ZJ581 TaxID=3342118 RepID=UPI0035A8220E